MKQYQNPENMDQKDLDFLRESDSGIDIVARLRDAYPDLITGVGDEYTKYLAIFKKNWEFVCGRFGCTPQQIILVNYIPDHTDQLYQVINLAYSRLAKLGYTIRSNEQLKSCTKCGRIILTQESCTKIEASYDKEDCCTFYNNHLANVR
jgi:hypothetical protein